MDIGGETLARKASHTFCDSRVSTIKGRYYWIHTCNGEHKSSAPCSRLQLNRGNIGPYRLVQKKVETLGNTSPKVKRCKHCSRHWAGWHVNTGEVADTCQHIGRDVKQRHWLTHCATSHNKICRGNWWHTGQGDRQRHWWTHCLTDWQRLR